MRKKKVLFIIPLPPPLHGSSMISQYIKNSCLINETFDCDYINLTTSRRMDEIGKNGFGKIWRALLALIDTIRHLMVHRYDICFISITCHGKGFFKDAPFAILCKFLGKELILHQENKGMSRDVDNWPFTWLMPFVYKNAKVVLLSWLLYPDIEKCVKKEQVVICPNCASPVLYETRYGCKCGSNILFLGNMIIGKGVLFLLDALEILRNKNVVFHCNFVGNETDEINRDIFQKEAKKRGLEGFADYLGPKVGEEKQRMLRQADIFVFPTFYHNECFPLVLLEAMQASLPIVTTDEGAIADIVKDGVNGLICEKNNPESLATCIFKLLADKVLQEKFGQAGFDKYQSEYTIQTFEKNIVEILQGGI